MGFSVSGSAAIIFAGMFIAFGMFHTATSNGFDRVSDAQQDRTDRTLRQQNTAINITSAQWDKSADELTVTVTNNGSTQLSVPDVDLLTDNTYRTGYSTSVDGDATTELWLPQEELTITLTATSDPVRVKIVTGPGVSATRTVVTV